MNATATRNSVPSPMEIRRQAREIRRTWTPAQRQNRRLIADAQQRRLYGLIFPSCERPKEYRRELAAVGT